MPARLAMVFWIPIQLPAARGPAKICPTANILTPTPPLPIPLNSRQMISASRDVVKIIPPIASATDICEPARSTS